MTDPAPSCPACQKPMKRRSGARGPFWGCSGYPSCRRTLPIAATAAEGASESSNAVGNGEAEASTPWSPPKAPTYKEALANYEEARARLDADQAAVASWKPSDGNLRVIAGAGAGKSSSVVATVARLIREAVVTPAQLVVTTFTSKAGKELAERLNRVVPPGALPQMRVGTFHGLALKALRGTGGWDMTHCLDIGKRAAGIPSTGQLWSKILGYAGEVGLPGTGEEGFGLEEPDAKAYSLAVDVARSHGLTGNALTDALIEAEREEGLPYLARAWSKFCAVKAALQAWDFADALQAWYELLSASTPAGPPLVVFVDESQDMSWIQLEIAKLLARGGSLMVIGDCRQCIYTWRGAYPEFFINIADHVVGIKTLQLRSNYRSGSAIVEAGNRTAAGQDWAVGDAAKAARAEAGTITTSGHQNPADEARAVVEQITRHANDGEKLDEMAILCRTNAMSGAFEAACIQASVPCVVVGGKPFFQRYEVQNAAAYVKLSYTDDLEAFARIVNKPRRYLGARFVEAVKGKLHAAGGLVPAIELASHDLYRKQRDATQEMYAWLLEFRAKTWPESVDMIVRLLTPAQDSDAGEADSDRSGLIAAVASLAKGFGSAEAFCEFAARCAGEVVEARAEDGGYVVPEGRVTISTIHRAKGLEYKYVFVSASSGTFPHARSMAKPARLAEETRLWYVAVSRAKDFLHASWSRVDLYGRPAGPSEFLETLGLEPEPDPDGGGAPEPAPLLSFEPSTPGALLELTKAAANFVDGAPDEDETTNYFVQERAAAEMMAAQWQELIAAGAKPVPGVPDALEMESSLAEAPSAVEKIFGPAAWAGAMRLAEVATAAEPKATAGEGGRYVQPTLEQFEALLHPLGCSRASRDVEMHAHQRVLELATQAEHGTIFIRVYTTVDLGEHDARECGEDSIKVAAVYAPGDDETAVKPLHKKLPYAARTRGWRLRLLEKIAELAPLILARCPRCGSPMAERRAPKGETMHVFWGCTRYPKCSGSKPANTEKQ